jgi:ABC-2 type transport system permease protein
VNVSMLWRALKDLRWTMMWYALGTVVYLAVIIALYPSMRGNTQQLEDLLDLYPEALRTAFGVEDLTTFVGFIGGESLSVMWPVIVLVFLIMAGTATVAQEIERGTIELWLSVPERRSRLLAAKIIAILLGATVITAATVLTLGVGAMLVDEALSPGALLAGAATMLAFSIAGLGIAVLLSALFSDRGKAAGLAALIVLASYLGWVVANISSTWHWLRYLSIFTGYDPQRALRTSEVSPAGVTALLLVGVVCALSALVVFELRDIMV